MGMPFRTLAAVLLAASLALALSKNIEKIYERKSGFWDNGARRRCPTCGGL